MPLTLYDTLTPSGNFALVNAKDVAMPDGTRLDQANLGGGVAGSGLPAVTTADNGKILQVVNGAWVVVALADSAVKTYIDEYISSALEGEY